MILLISIHEQARRELRAILEKEYDFFAKPTQAEAFAFLKERCDEVSMVITELQEAEKYNYAFLRKMNEDERLKAIPVMVTCDGNMDANLQNVAEGKCLEAGAADFVREPFVPETVRNRVKGMIRLRKSTVMLASLERDPLTGLYAKEFFFKKVEEYLSEHQDKKYLFLVSDVQGLKVINEKYGFDVGDQVLSSMASHGAAHISGFIFGGRIEGDKLAGLIEARDMAEIEENLQENDANTPYPIPNVKIKHGIYRIDPRLNVKPKGMYDRAMLATQKIKSLYGVCVAEYDDELRKDLLLKQLILGSADDALKNHQFKVYYQPKHDLRLNRTCGAEGLVRWMHPDIGFISPFQFISLFEQNGFITKLDFYVWEEICKTMKKWEREGVPIVPVSINVSRRDFQVPDLAGKITELVDSYDVLHGMIHVEVTESAYSDDPVLISETVRKLHDNGFVIEMDDFGTAYSSLMSLTSMYLDVLKLDRRIIVNDKPDSEKSILEYSMQLAKLLELKTIAEGVETKEQMERFAQLGGDYVQGYYYSKPLPEEEFARYLLQENSRINKESDASG